MRIKVVITENLTRVFECKSLNDGFNDMDSTTLRLYRELKQQDVIVVIPRFLYWEDITEKESTEIVELTHSGFSSSTPGFGVKQD